MKCWCLVVIGLFITGVTIADPNDPVVFNDPHLEAVIEAALGPSPTEAQMLGLHILDATNKGIADLTGLEYALNLEYAVMFHNHITDITPLTGLTSMQNLNLLGNQISDINALSGMTDLFQLYINDNQITDINAVSGLLNMQVLYLQNNQITDIAALTHLTKLETLYLDDNHFISDISALAGLTKLEHLGLSGNQISDVNALSGLDKVEELELSDNQISDLAPLSGLTTNLFFLYLSDNQISDINALSGLTKLYTLSLNNNQISDINDLASLTALHQLYLSNNHLTDINALSGVTKLLELDLSQNQISDIDPLSGLTSQSSIELNLSHNNISDISPLTGLPSIFVIFDLSHNQISDISALSGLSSLFGAELNLSYNQISDISTLAALSGTIALTGDLDLRGNPLNDAAYQTHIPTIEGNATTVLYGWTLTTSSTLGGVVTAPGEGAFSYDDANVVPLTASPAAHYHFVDWTGSAVDANQVTDPNAADTTVTMDSYYHLQADFAIDQHTLTTTSSAGGSVTVPGEGIHNYDYGAVVNLVAAPEAHYHFVYWTGTAVDAGMIADSGSASTTVTMKGNYTLVANFALDTHSLNVTSDGNGSVTGSRTYTYGSTAPITATAHAHYHFVNWTATGSVIIADSGLANTTVTIHGNGTVTAHFAIDTFRLNYTAAADGGLAGDTSQVVDYGSDGTAVTAIPESGYHFVNWSDDSTDNPRTDTHVTANISVSANFAINIYQVTVNSNAHGHTDKDGVNAVNYGDTLTITPSPATGCHFIGWTGDASGTDNPLTVTVTSNLDIAANFAIDVHTLTISSSVGGFVTVPGEGSYPYDYGSTLSLTAEVSDPCFVFSHFEGNLWAGTNPYLLTVNHDYTIRAVFESILDVLFVDTNIPDDQHQNGSPEFPFNSIQKAIEVARAGSTIVIAPGTYEENLTLKHKGLILTGVDANDWNWPVIQSPGMTPVVSVHDCNDPNTLLQGLILSRGDGSLAGGIDCDASQLTLANCLIVGNRADSLNGMGGGVYAHESLVNLVNCTLSDNYGGSNGAGLYTDSNSVVTVLDSILWDHGSNEIFYDATSDIVVQYSDIAGGFIGVGNQDTDPNFIAPGHWEHALNPGLIVDPWQFYATWKAGDYHVDANSPCIDAGDPNALFDLEPEPNGQRVNQGAYGGTSQASWSPE